MLLHVIEPPRPVDPPAHNSISRRRNALDHVKHALIAVVDTLHHTQTVKCSRVARLTSAGWIERGAIKPHSGPTTDTFSNIDDTSFKLDQVRISVIETFGYSHLSSKIVRPCTLVHANS